MSETVRSRLISSTVESLKRHGVAGTSISDLLERSGVARRSIYINFPGGKSDLIAESVRQAGDAISAFVEHLVATQPPSEALRVFIEFWKQSLSGSHFEAGCPIAAGAYGGDDAPGARVQAAQVFSQWERLLTPNLVTHGINPDDATDVATTTVAAIEGAVMLCLATASTDPLDRIHSQLDRLLQSYASRTDD